MEEAEAAIRSSQLSYQYSTPPVYSAGEYLSSSQQQQQPKPVAIADGSMTEEQSAKLERLFSVQPDPTDDEVEMYAAATQLSAHATAEWFACKRSPRRATLATIQAAAEQEELAAQAARQARITKLTSPSLQPLSTSGTEPLAEWSTPPGGWTPGVTAAAIAMYCSCLIIISDSNI